MNAYMSQQPSEWMNDFIIRTTWRKIHKFDERKKNLTHLLSFLDSYAFLCTLRTLFETKNIKKIKQTNKLSTKRIKKNKNTSYRASVWRIVSIFFHSHIKYLKLDSIYPWKTKCCRVHQAFFSSLFLFSSKERIARHNSISLTIFFFFFDFLFPCTSLRGCEIPKVIHT